MKALRYVLLGIAVAVLIGLGWRISHPDLRSTAVNVRPSVTTPVPQAQAPRQPTAPEARSMVLSRLNDVPDYIPFFDRLRSEFPAEYLALVDASARTVLGGAHVPNPDRLITDAVRNLRQAQGVLAGQAEPQPLASVFEAQSAMLDALSTDPTLCVDFLYGGISPTFMAFAATHRDLVERLAIANLTAISNGKHSKISRDPPTNQDFDAVSAALKAKGVSDDEVSALLDGKTFDPPLPEKSLCEAGRTYLHVLDSMPDDTRTRIYALSAALMARS